MKLAIMQPYFFPYIGYFQLINYVDSFIIYDNIEYTKKGWINRNRILVNGISDYISLPLKKDSDYLPVDKRCLAENWEIANKKLINRIKEAYIKAPYFNEVFPLVQTVLSIKEENLFLFIFESLKRILAHLEINTEIRRSSEVKIDLQLKNEKKVLAICKACQAKQYINPIGGQELYSKSAFNENGIELFFLKPNDIEYKQFKDSFVPKLSIIDVLMFNSKERTKQYIDNSFEII